MRRKSPLDHRIAKRRAERQPERVNVHYRSRHPANRTGSVDGMLGGVIVMVVIGAAILLKWGAR